MTETAANTCPACCRIVHPTDRCERNYCPVALPGSGSHGAQTEDTSGVAVTSRPRRHENAGTVCDGKHVPWSHKAQVKDEAPDG